MLFVLRHSLFLAAIACSATLAHAESGDSSPEPAAAKECRDLKAAGFEDLGGIRPPWEAKRIRARGLATLDRAIELCWRVAKEAQDPGLAAEMAAITYLSKARRSMALREPPERRRETLEEGIEVVRGFHHDRDPALIPLLKQSAFVEWSHDHELAAERMEQAVEIARRAYGANDVRLAVRLIELGFLYSPSSTAPSRKGTDARKAELAYEDAARVFATQEDPRAHTEEMMRLVAHMEELFAVTGRDEEAAEVSELFSELLAEKERLREAESSETPEPEEPQPEELQIQESEPEEPRAEESSGAVETSGFHFEN